MLDGKIGTKDEVLFLCFLINQYLYFPDGILASKLAVSCHAHRS